jgi:hypothetical protein
MRKIVLSLVFALLTFSVSAQYFVTKKVPAEFVKIKLDSVFVTDSSNLFSLIEDSITIFPSATANQYVIYNGSSWVADDKVIFNTGGTLNTSDTLNKMSIGTSITGQYTAFRTEGIEQVTENLGGSGAEVRNEGGDFILLSGDCAGQTLSFANISIENGFSRSLTIIGDSTLTNGCIFDTTDVPEVRIKGADRLTFSPYDVLELKIYKVNGQQYVVETSRETSVKQ